MKHLSLLLFFLFPASFALSINAEVVETVNTDVVLQNGEDFHILSAVDAIAEGAAVNIVDEDSWLVFDSVKPNDVVKSYSRRILIAGSPLVLETNAHICVYGTGTAVVAHGSGYQPLTTYTGSGFNGDAGKYTLSCYYTNCPPANAPDSLVRRLNHDNGIRSFRLKRGYMATFATNPDGMGYSKVYVADREDLELSSLPLELDGKISFVRVFRWQYPTKKGWAGSTWSAMPEGLKYAPEQASLTNSTWYYNWGSKPTVNPLNPDKNYNQEFVPEKWGYGGLWNGIYSITDASHLLGYNEPDHSEQSHVSVEKAVEEWPMFVQTGMRLGSPAITDFEWLYNFMRECNRRNYRVDYVVVHAYWGGLSADEWYEKLKSVYQHTKRPIWIKEWNNGANWTKETWPSSKSEQYAKQLRDITAIVTMLDTCSFVERYSIYNWVEDKRMIIDSKGKLTPAGEFFAAQTSPYFFNRANEATVKWNISEAPVLKYDSISADGNLSLSWTDFNGEQIDRYIVLENEFAVDTVAGNGKTMEFVPVASTGYSVKSVPADTSKKGLLSNRVEVAVTDNDETAWFHAGEMLLREQWKPVVLKTPISSSPLLFAGVPTYRNKLPLATLAKRITPRSADLRLRTWDYQQNPSFYYPDTLSFAFMPPCRYKDENMQIEAGRVSGIGEAWKQVNFSSSFADTPVVVLSPQDCIDATAFQLCLRNVTRHGFEIRLRYEGNNHHPSASAAVGYWAATTGATEVCGHRIVVGTTADGAVGSCLYEACDVAIGEKYTVPPMVFAQMQTENDTITSTLRLHQRQCGSFRIFKDREKSVAHELVKPERVGWITVGTSVSAGMERLCSSPAGKSYSISGMPLDGKKCKGKLVGLKKGKSLNIKLFNY